MVVVGLDAVRRARPRPDAHAGTARRSPGRDRALLHRDRRRHRRPRVRVQAADRPLRRAACRGRARGGVRVHPRRHPHVPILLDAKRGDIGSTAEFYAREAFGRYRRRRGDVQPVPRHRCGRAVARARVGVRDLPHEQPGQWRAPGPRCRRPAAVRAGRRDGRDALGRARRGRSRRRRHLPRAAPVASARSSATSRSSFPASAPRAATSRPRYAPARRPRGPVC